MIIETKEVQLRILTADEGKVIVSKQKNEDGNPIVTAKEIYLGIEDSEENYMEVEEYGN